jgi:hypothetical protein
MALIRRGQKVYHYSTERVDGRVVRIYNGSGHDALEFARRDRKIRRGWQETWAFCREMKAKTKALEAARRAARTARIAAFVEDIETFSRAGLEAFQDVEAAFEAEMERRGFHRHDRGSWRRRRGMTVSTTNTLAVAEGAAVPAPADEQARGRKAPASPEPAVAGTIRRCAVNLLTQACTDPKTRVVFAAALEAECRSRAEEFGADDPDPLVRQLAHRAALAALECDVLTYVNAPQDPIELSPRAMRSLQTAREGADKRFHRAVRSLDMVRTRAHRPAAVAVAVAVAVPGDGR